MDLLSALEQLSGSLSPENSMQNMQKEKERALVALNQSLERIASIYPPGFMATLTPEQLAEIDLTNADLENTLKEDQPFDDFIFRYTLRRWLLMWLRLLGYGQEKTRKSA